MKAIVFSDIHFHLWEQHTKRFDAQLQVFEHLVKLSDKNECPLLFGGDMFHTPKDIKNSLLGILIPFFKATFEKYPKAKIYAISGNHDQATENYVDNKAPSYVATLAQIIPNFECIDFKWKNLNGFSVYGIPYLSHNIGLEDLVKDAAKKIAFKDLNILMVHTDFKGQKDTNGIVVGQGQNFKESTLSPFDLVFSGHIHQRAKLRDKVYSIGSPLQLRLSDKDSRFGFWIVADDNEVRFREIEFTPKYRTYTNPSEINNETDIWVKLPRSVDELTGGEVRPLSNKEIVNQYLLDMGIKSKLKRVKLKEIVNKVW